jgi:hypothetical protein
MVTAAIAPVSVAFYGVFIGRSADQAVSISARVV